MNKKSIATMIILFISVVKFSFAQENVILSGGNYKNGGYGAVEVKSFQFDDDSVLMVGGRGGWIINSFVTIGGAGYGTSGGVEDANGNDLDISYGGFMLGFILFSDQVVHLEFNTLFGSGVMGSTDSTTNVETTDNFSITEPSLNLEFNMTEFFRIAAGVGYRMVNGLDYNEYESTDLQGTTANLGFKFGMF